MKEYVVEITEVLQHQETVKAHSKNEAINVVREKYKNEDVILNDENITDLRFDVLEVRKNFLTGNTSFSADNKFINRSIILLMTL